MPATDCRRKSPTRSRSGRCELQPSPLIHFVSRKFAATAACVAGYLADESHRPLSPSPPDPGQLSGPQIVVQVPQMHVEVVSAGSLGPVVRKFLEVADPEVVISPVEVCNRRSANLELAGRLLGLHRHLPPTSSHRGIRARR